MDDCPYKKTAKEAMAAGGRFYFTGKPCKRGHLSKRYLKGSCWECCRDYRRKFQAKLAEYLDSVGPTKKERERLRAEKLRERAEQQLKEKKVLDALLSLQHEARRMEKIKLQESLELELEEMREWKEANG